MRFSLKTLIVSVVFIALCFSLWVVSQRLQDATVELTSQRDELGHLNVKDPKKINFISVPQHEAMKWRWRLQLPVDRKYNLCFKTIGISEGGFPQPHTTFFVDGGDEFTVTVLCHRDQRGRWNITAMTTAGHSQNLGFLGRIHDSWFEGRATHSRLNGQRQTTLRAADEPAELLRLRIKGAGDSPTDSGILVWIAEATDR